MTEAQLQAAIIELAVVLGYRHYHTFNSRKSPSGFPDLVLVRAPRIVFAELKSAQGSLTAEQKEWMASLAACPSVETCLWGPADWLDGTIEKVLR